MRGWIVLGWIWVAVICALSLIPAPELPGPDVPFADKWAHLVAYGGLALWWRQQALPSSIRLWALPALVALGAMLELLQGLSSYRQADLWDVGANSLGVLIGALLATTFPGRVLRHDLGITMSRHD